jgi:Metallo-beta-lactamase superfamily
VSTPPAIQRPPEAEQLEITLFGGGLGESVLCHLGDRRWLMVDSFRSPAGQPVADEYLDNFGGDHRIVAVVATHWDDDHTHGMADVLMRHEPDEVWMSIVLNEREVFRFAVEHVKSMEGRAPSGLRDFVDVLRAIEGRRIRRWGMVGRSVETGTDVVVRLLSPSDELVDRGLAALGMHLEPGFGEVTSPPSNRTSIVLWVSRGTACALLGADLEAGDLGWTAVLDRGSPDGAPASVIKVPHHGSSDADEPRIWSEWATPTPVNCVTRYTRLAQPLPREDDINRLTARAGPLHIAGRLPDRLRGESVDFDVHLQVASTEGVRPARGPVGMIRARSNENGAWSVEPYGAVEVAQPSTTC